MYYFSLLREINFIFNLTKIGLISDTHNYLDDAVFKHFENCDEIWHAGDFGTAEIAEKLKAFKPLKGSNWASLQLASAVLQATS